MDKLTIANRKISRGYSILKEDMNELDYWVHEIDWLVEDLLKLSSRCESDGQI
jgi:hypothetical protein